MQKELLDTKADLENEKERETQITADIQETEKQLAEVKGSKKKDAQSQEGYLKQQKKKLATQRDNLAQCIDKLNSTIVQSENKIESMKQDKIYKAEHVDKERHDAEKAKEQANQKTVYLEEKVADCKAREGQLREIELADKKIQKETEKLTREKDDQEADIEEVTNNIKKGEDDLHNK